MQRVWKINHPVSIVDFGCGYGFLGLKLLPILPEGSRYTGIDMGKELIAKADELFSGAPFATEFHIGDVNEFKADEKFDIAICHAVLLHMTDPKKTLCSMKDSVKKHGLVICFEPFWLSAMSHTYVHEIPQTEILKLGILQKLYESDANATGKDGNIGIKLPIYMSEIGLVNVGSRISDKVNYLNPSDSMIAKQALYESLCEEGLSHVPQNRETYIENLVKRGLSNNEAQELFNTEVLLGTRFGERGIEYNTVTAPTMTITYGTVAE